MRDLFQEIFTGEPIDPMESARKGARPLARRRFYKEGDVGETAVIVFLKGPTATYSVQWAKHAAAQASPIGYSAGDWDEQLAALLRIRLCDPAGEEAPYPSCR